MYQRNFESFKEELLSLGVPLKQEGISKEASSLMVGDLFTEKATEMAVLEGIDKLIKESKQING